MYIFFLIFMRNFKRKNIKDIYSWFEIFVYKLFKHVSRKFADIFSDQLPVTQRKYSDNITFYTITF